MPGSPKKGKASVGDRAQQFLTAIGTAGGPIGSPGLVSFGAGALQEQLAASQYNPYYARQQAAAKGGAVVGSPNMGTLDPGLGTPSMPMDFDSGYLHLNVPGSPLPMYGLMADHNLKAAQITQDQIMAMQQYSLLPFIPQTGQLPVSPMMMQKPATKGRR